MKTLTRRWILQHLADDIAIPLTSSNVVIVQHWEDFRIFLGSGNRARYRVFRIDAVYYPIAINNVINTHREKGSCRAQLSICGTHVQPIGKEQIDLVDMRLERGETVRVVDIEGGAQAFVGIQRNVGWLAMRPPPRWPLGCLFEIRLRLQGLVVALLRGQQKLRQRLPLDDAESENGEYNGQHNGGDVQNTAQPFPAFPLRIIKNLFHSLPVFSLSLYCRGFGLFVIAPSLYDSFACWLRFLANGGSLFLRSLPEPHCGSGSSTPILKCRAIRSSTATSRRTG